MNQLAAIDWKTFYWREHDFVVFGIEVKNGKIRQNSGFRKFKEKYLEAKTIVVGSEGIKFEEFFSKDA